MKLIAGSYERFLLGYTLKKVPPAQAGTSPGEETHVEAAAAAQRTHSLVPAFTYAGHLGPIKCLAASGAVLASGGSDDIIRVYDLKASKDMGSLLQHEGAVTCLEFFGPRGHPTHLLSGSADSSICVWDTDAWTHLQTLKGHRAPVNDLTVHPSGRLGLSVGRDQMLKMWDLIKGRCTFSTRLQAEGELVGFMPEEGKQYALASGQSVGVFSAETGKEERVLTHQKRVLCLAQSHDNVIVTAGEAGFISFWDWTSGKPILEWSSAHGNRVRGLAVGGGLGAESAPSPQTLPARLSSASSDGLIRVWDPRRVGGGREAVPVAEVQTGGRLTCLVEAGAVAAGLPSEGRSSKKSVRMQDAAGNGKDDVQEHEQDGGKSSVAVGQDVKSLSKKLAAKESRLQSVGNKVGKKRKT